MMDLLLAPESFLLSERYASAVKTLGLAIFFMPVLPLSCVIALAGQHRVLAAPGKQMLHEQHSVTKDNVK